ncbi:MAG: recombinase family protein [Defluviitaleaceae bacterium]|nr:recombinase family protein [Defluviitaleaceae bacterium]MCL2261945.1 recombinase family protein [Defluviitaleaceae bacterium]
MFNQRKAGYVIGGYSRLSHEDGANIESHSIKNQRELIKQFILEQSEFKGASFVEYVDDGVSGTHTERQSYQRLMADVERGDVDCIIVKDLSRIGRNMLDTDDLLMNQLVSLNVRFIAINNHYDSFKHPLSNLELAIINLANQHYVRDLAEKAAASRRIKQQKGEHMANPPFGYKKCDKIKNLLVPDEDTADFVRLIFSLAVEGRKAVEIAQILNSQDIPTPYVCKNVGYAKEIDPGYYYWTNIMVARIIRHPAYMGSVVSCKTKADYLASKKKVPTPKSEWVIVPNVHEALVSEDDFQKAQRVLEKPKPLGGGMDNLFMKKVVCPTCGHNMARYPNLNPYFKCRTAKFTDKFACPPHSIMQSIIESAVLSSIRAYANTLIDREQLQLAALEKEMESIGELERKIRDEQKSIQFIESSLPKLFKSFASGKITQEVFMKKKGIINDTTVRKQVAVAEMTERLTAISIGHSQAKGTVEAFSPFIELEALTKEAVDLLISKIVVHGEKDIEIIWNGRDEYESHEPPILSKQKF